MAKHKYKKELKFFEQVEKDLLGKPIPDAIKARRKANFRGRNYGKG